MHIVGLVQFVAILVQNLVLGNAHRYFIRLKECLLSQPNSKGADPLIISLTVPVRRDNQRVLLTARRYIVL